MEKIKKIRPQDMAMEQIQWYIQENQLKPHTQLPSERELCTMWQMNRSTLHTAIQQLIEERKLYSVKGSGTFVAPPRLVRDIKGIQSTSEAMRKTGYFLWTEVLISRIETCDGYVARKLQIKEGDIVFHLYRLRIRNNVPLMIENSYINYEQCEGLEAHNFAEESLYKVLGDLGILLTKGTEKVGITFATEEEAKLLKVEEVQYLYYQSGVVNDDRGVGIEFFRIMARPDQVQYTNVLTRRDTR